MKPSLKRTLIAIILTSSVLLVGCNLKKSASGSPTGSATGPVTAPTTQTIGGTVTGLTGTGMVIENNGADDLTIIANGTFTFKTAVSGAYAVTIKTQPSSPTQSCTVSFGTGTATANVTNVLINCGNGLTIGGSVSGLPIMAQPNAGLPVLEDMKVLYKETPEQMVAGIPALLEAGARIIGGCCGSTPSHIRKFREVLDART